MSTPLSTKALAELEAVEPLSRIRKLLVYILSSPANLSESVFSEGQTLSPFLYLNIMLLLLKLSLPSFQPFTWMAPPLSRIISASCSLVKLLLSLLLHFKYLSFSQIHPDKIRTEGKTFGTGSQGMRVHMAELLVRGQRHAWNSSIKDQEKSMPVAAPGSKM